MKYIGLAVAVALFTPAAVHAIDVNNTRMLAMPAVHGDKLAFVYDNDLWLASRAGGTARRLTQSAGQESLPHFSPDGKWLAFSADYGDNVDVYVMPASGGEMRRLTWHPGQDIVRGFTPDSASVLFESPDGQFTNRLRYLYTVPVTGGPPTRLPIPSGSKAALSPDGKTIAYTPNQERFQQWKNYRGGTQSRIWLMNLSDYAVKEVPKPAGGSNDTDPMWIGDTLYFNSDRNGEFNLFRYDAASAQVNQLTTLKDFPVTNPDASAEGVIVFEQGGYLHEFDTRSGTQKQIVLSAISDLAETRPRIASDVKWVREAAASPDLKRIAFNYRGEIVSVPADKGDPRQLTRSPGANDHSPAWSADGKQIAWFSDESGEYELLLGNQDGSGKPKHFKLEGAGYYDTPKFSPDSKRIAYRDNSQSLWVTDLISGRNTKIASEPVYSPLGQMSANWSPDSHWLAYTVQTAGLIQTVHAWSVDSGKPIRITDGLSEMVEPVFDPNGEFLYVLASTDAGPLKDWFSQISNDNTMNHGLYAITLRRDGPNAIPPQSDEVDLKAQKDEPAKGKDGGKDKKADKKPVVRIDAEGIGDRIVALPAGTGTRRGLKIGASGEIYFLETIGQQSFQAFGGPAELKRFTLEDREAKTIAKKVEDFLLSSDGKRIAYRVDKDWFVTEVKDELPAGKGKLALDKISVAIDPRAEWSEILDDAWRINRDYFYASNFQGADWPAMRTKYRALLPDLATRSDLDRVIRMMLSELSVGHSFLGLGDYPFKPKKIPVGLLGADYEISGDRYRFRKILGGLNWNPDLRSPLRTPGVEVKVGEYLLAVDGVSLRAPASVYAAFENRAGKQVRLTVGPSADGRNSRDVIVVPVDNETNLRYLDWVEGNLHYVEQKSDGRLAYVHVPDTGELGHEAFKRYFYPQSDRAGIIVDERFNGGGQIADYYIDILRRPLIAHWSTRYGSDLVSPRGAIFGPKVMITDETAGSGGDLLPWMFKRFELGPVVGKRTWGGLVGILGFPVLMDGGSVTAPNLAFWNEDGYAIENIGVPPDVVVEQWPAEVNAGRDPQLDRAIDIALQNLQKNPPAKAQRPPLPVRTR
jgi:tricorn protease